MITNYCMFNVTYALPVISVVTVAVEFLELVKVTVP